MSIPEAENLSFARGLKHQKSPMSKKDLFNVGDSTNNGLVFDVGGDVHALFHDVYLDCLHHP